MITLRRSEERRHIDSEEQKTWMTFDRENQADPLRDGFGALRIFNEEILSPGRAFVLQTNQDMVVVTYVNEGVMIFNRPKLEKPASWNQGTSTTPTPLPAPSNIPSTPPARRRRAYSKADSPRERACWNLEGIKSTSPSPSARVS